MMDSQGRYTLGSNIAEVFGFEQKKRIFLKEAVVGKALVRRTEITYAAVVPDAKAISSKSNTCTEGTGVNEVVK